MIISVKKIFLKLIRLTKKIHFQHSIYMTFFLPEKLAFGAIQLLFERVLINFRSDSEVIMLENSVK